MRIGYAFCFLLASGIALNGSAQKRGAAQAQAQTEREIMRHPLRMTISGFADGAKIPTKFTCVAKGHGASPEIRWRQVPAGTKSFILLLHDPEAHPGMGSMDTTHWLIWNIPGTARSLPEGIPAGDTLPDGAHQLPGHGSPVGVYFGPCAPPGPNHHYTWDLYALDTKLDLPATASREQVMDAASGHILSTAVWIGLFHR